MSTHLAGGAQDKAVKIVVQKLRECRSFVELRATCVTYVKSGFLALPCELSKRLPAQARLLATEKMVILDYTRIS